MEVPFDNGHPGRYQIEIFPERSELGDDVVLNADRAGFLALAEVFLKLAQEESETHIHLGDTSENPSGPGWFWVRGACENA